MDSLLALKALKDKLRKDVTDLGGDKKFHKKSDLEQARLKRLRDEEQEERLVKENKKQQTGIPSELLAQKAKEEEAKHKEAELNKLPPEEVIRRLRALRQPATLFGEEDVDRVRRLVRAEQDLLLYDEALQTGGQANSIIELQREAKLKKREERDRKRAVAENPAGEGASGAEPEPEDPVLAAFKHAAVLLAEQREEEALALEDRIMRHLRKWSKEWQEDLERRPDDIKARGAGVQSTLQFKQTMQYLEPLYHRLKHRSIEHDELRTGLWMIVQACLQRNYLYANDVYLKLAIGTAPWPIGVTSVGIHERSSREKISHVMNAQGQAHVMNDEATRKYLQAIKRIMTFVQRMHPTDPSRSVEFNTCENAGRGATGAGSDKVALLEAEARGESWTALGLPQAPHYLEKDGKVRVPTKWTNILGRAKAQADIIDAQSSAATLAQQQQQQAAQQQAAMAAATAVPPV